MSIMDWETQLQNLIKFAENLPWSEGATHECQAEKLIEEGIVDTRQKIYQGLSQYLLEHIIMTSIARHGDLLKTVTDKTIRMVFQSVVKDLKETQIQTGITFPNLMSLLSHYFESLQTRSDDKESPSSVGQDCVEDICHWSMGCPAKKVEHVVPGYDSKKQPLSGFTDMLNIELDHYVPKSRVARNFGAEKLPGLSMCRMHNISWKKNLLCYGLQPELQQTNTK